MPMSKKQQQLVNEPGFYLGPFGKGKQCGEKGCKKAAFSSTDDNRVRCFEHTVSYIKSCAAKSLELGGPTPQKLYTQLIAEITKLHVRKGV